MSTETEKNKFLEAITAVKIEKDISYLDAVIWYCEYNDLEISVASDLTNSTLKGYLEKDASSLKLLK